MSGSTLSSHWALWDLPRQKPGTWVDVPVEGPICWVTWANSCPWPHSAGPHTLDGPHNAESLPCPLSPCYGLPNHDLELAKIYEVCTSLRPPPTRHPYLHPSAPSETINRAFTYQTPVLGRALGKGFPASSPSPHRRVLRLQRRSREGERPAQDHIAAQQDQNVGPEDSKHPTLKKKKVFIMENTECISK